MTRASPVICIDGPSGAGKGTLSQSLATQLGWHLLDSGALYRVVGFASQQKGVPLEDESAVAAVARELDVAFQPSDVGVLVLLEGQNVTSAVRSEEGGRGASIVAALPEVRTALLSRQQKMAGPPGLIADGRDMGTVVFPDAELKLFLTASPEARAQRRFHQLQGHEGSDTLARLLEDIQARDARDEARAVSPLRPAEDAVVIDSTALSAHEVLELALQHVASRGIESETSE